MQDYHGIKIDLDRDSLLNEFSRSLLQDYYMLPEETSPQEAFARAALAYSFGNMDFAQRIYDYASKQWFMFASPVISNAPAPGAKWKALPISCFLTYVEDNLESLIDHSSEVRWLSVKGGGVGGHWSSVRSVSNKAPGPIPFLKTIDSDMQAYTQGITRRASYAAYLDVSHPDIIEFLEMRLPTGGDPNRKCFNIHNAINITDKFMEACIKNELWDLVDPSDGSVRDTIGARDLLQKIIEVRFKTGEPYMCFIDTANKHLPEALKRLGLKIHGSNLCIAGDQRVVTSKGYLTARELYESGEPLQIFDGTKVCNASKMQLIKRNAPTYKITLKNGLSHTVTSDHKVKTQRGDISVSDLVYGDKIFVQSKKGLFGSWNLVLDFNQAQSNSKRVPDHIWLSNEFVQTLYLKDLLGENHDEITNVRLFTSGFTNEFISEIQALRANLGLLSDELQEITNIEFVSNQDVFCLYVDSDEHHFVSNGFITHNCNEIMLSTSINRTAVCCLSSLNLEHFDEWQDTNIVQDMIKFLDNVLQVFIENCPDVLHKARFSAERERSLGLGTLGFHSYLQKHMVPFDSAMATVLNKHVFKIIKERAIEETMRLAEVRGAYPDDHEAKYRNAHLLAIAPNANSAIIANSSASIEPWKSNSYAHRMRAGTFLVRNQALAELLKSKVTEDQLESIWDSITLNHGSVQHLDILDDYEKSVFKTAFEIDQKWLVQHAADRQPYVCQGQSLNLFFPAGADRNYVLATHIKAWRDGLKGLYYLRTTAGVNVNISEKVERVPLADYAQQEECLSCQG